jgi:acyl transferase domain-containing protein/thioesterase domain-containing protein/acyl carrier protein
MTKFQPQDGFGEPLIAGLDNSIAVIGMAGRFAGAVDIDAYWQNLRNGVESIVTLDDDALIAAGVSPALLKNPNYVKAGAPLPDMEMFDAAFFGLSPREAAIMDPQHRQFLECAWEAIENSAHPPERFPGAIAVFAGSGFSAYMPFNLLTNPKLVDSVGMFLLRHAGNDKDFLTTRVSYLLNLKGPSVNVQTACSTSLVAIHMAVQSLLNRECDMALAGGSTIELPHNQGYLHQDGGILSPDGHCRAFDERAQGTVFGSGVGAVVLRRLADALADDDHIYAVIRGSAVNNDGAGKVGYLAPSVDGQANAITEALAIADVPVETITYVEAHGTGTPVGDPIEVAALTQAFRQSTNETGYCAIGSVKGNIGHTDTAAGIAGFIKVALAMTNGELPPTLHYSLANPACEFANSPFYVNAALRPWTPPIGVPRRAGISSLGVGGTNAHVVLEQAPRRRVAKSGRAHHLLTISAKTSSALDANTAALARHLAANPGLDLGDVAYTLQIGRQAMKHRRRVVAGNASEAATLLEEMTSPRIFSNAAPAEGRDVVFMFPGGGSQYPDMGLDLYRSEAVFRDAVDECLEMLEVHNQLDIRKWLYPEAGEKAAAVRELERPAIGLPALFTIQYAQAKLWMSWGLTPKAMIGHSFGEYMAAHLAGVFDLGDALDLVVLKGRLFETLPSGRMISVALAEQALRGLLGPGLDIAAVNGPALTVATGPEAGIALLKDKLRARDIGFSSVPISIAAHSDMLAPMLAEFGAFFRRLTLRPPRAPFISNVTGTWIKPAEAVDPNYWVRQTRQTVRFSDGLSQLFHDPNCVLLEVGPGRTLSSLARSHPARQATQPVFNSLRHPDELASDVAYVLDVLGKLWSVGATVNWGSFWQSQQQLRVPLPTYRFDHQRFWIEPGTAVVMADDDPDTELERKADPGDWFYQPVWQRADRPRTAVKAVVALVFEDNSGLATRLAEQLSALGRDVVLVRAGRRFARKGRHLFTIEPGSPADYEAMISRLSNEGRTIGEIFHLWTVTGSQRRQTGIAAAENLQRRGFYSLLYLAQAIGHEDTGAPIDLAVVSDHSQRLSTETGLIPAKATVFGACKVIPREFPNVRARSIDVVIPAVGTREMRDLVEDLIAENSAADDAEVVAYRASERWLQSWAPVRLDPPAARPRSLRVGGVYLITGGLGGIGLALARHLAETAAARLVLVGRSGLPPRELWSKILAEAETDDSVAEQIRQVAAIEQLGAEVLVLGADVCNVAQMRFVVQQGQARFGPIDGVFHTAGVIDAGLVQLKDAHAAAAVLAPKVRGTLVLEEVLADQRPGFIMLFSSISASAGLAGQIDYAAANAFLDAYAQAHSARDFPCVVAVDWSQWQEVGMAAALARDLGLPADRLDINPPTGHPLLGSCIRDTPAERVYETRLAAATHWFLDEHRIAAGDRASAGQALIPGTAYLEIVRAALAHHAEARPIEIANLVFVSPFVVDGDEQRTMRVELRRKLGDGWHFSISGRPTDAAQDAAWIEHVRGDVAYVDALRPAAIETTSILAQCRLRSHLGDLPSHHMRFGARWHNMKRIDYGANKALIRLELAPEYVDDLETFQLHPALLDFATAGAQALIADFDEQADFFVPASYGCVRIHKPLTQSLVSHVRYHGDCGAEAGVAVFDVTIMNKAGDVLVEIFDFTMMQVDEASTFSTGTTPARDARPKPRTTGAKAVLAQRLDASIRPSEGMEIIDRILDARTGPQIAVSPQPFAALVKRLRAPAVPVAGTADLAAPGGALGGGPASNAEKLVAELWSEMLGVPEVGRADNFFDLGGHSLLAVQLINKIKRRTGKALPLTALLEAPTLAALAALVEPPPADAAEVLVTAEVQPAGAENSAASYGQGLVRIRAGCNKLPIYFVHDGLGETLLYRTLALKLDSGHPVYGLQPQARVDGSFLHTTIAEMAAAHIKTIRTVQHNGPYLLAGLCAGGVIAFEMARQLEDEGERTLFVGIIDAADVEASERPFNVTRHRLASLFATLGSATSEPLSRRLAMFVPRATHKAWNAAAYEIAIRVDNFHTARSLRQLQNSDEGAEGFDDMATAMVEPPSFLKMYRLAHRKHKPHGLFSSGDVVLFKATKGNGAADDAPFGEQFSDYVLGWGKRVASDVRLIEIPGGHSSALQNPHVATLARAMRECIAAALLKWPVEVGSLGGRQLPADTRVLRALEMVDS